MSNSCLSLKHHQLSTSKQIQRAKGRKNCSCSQAWLAYLYMCLSAAARVIKSRRCDEMNRVQMEMLGKKTSTGIFFTGILFLFFLFFFKSHCLLMILHDSSLRRGPNWILAGEAKQRIMLRLYYPPLAPHNWFSWSLWSRVMFGSRRRQEGFLKFDCARHKGTRGTSGTVRSELLFFFFFFSPPRTPPATNTQRCVQQTYKKKKK